MNRKVIILDNQNWCYVYHKWHEWRVRWYIYTDLSCDEWYDTSISHHLQSIRDKYDPPYKKDISVSYWKLPGQEEETDQVFFLNTVQFARTFCFTWLTWFTPRRIHTIRGETCHWSFWVRFWSLQNEQFLQKRTISPFKCKTFGSNIKFTISQWLTSSVVPLTNERFYRRI